MYDRKPLVRMVAWTLALGLLTFAAASCGKKESTPESSSTTPAPAESTKAAPTITDANIAAIVVAANTADIENGKQAETKSKNADVKAFAKQMIADHTSVNAKAVALATKLNLTPEDNDTSKGLKAAQDSIRTAIKDKMGADFNKAYVDNEVTYHQAVLDAIDQALIPNAQNAELKQLLTDVRPAIAAHLDHAKQIQAKLSSSAAK
jgi:putative membrane protein